MQEELRKYEDKMEKTIHALEVELNTVRAGRANPHVLDKISVNYYGQDTALNQVGNISIPEPRLIQIQPWDSTLLKEIEKAINVSDLGIHPNNDGKVIRLVFPELTEERRKELSKEVKKMGEHSKVAIRNIRRDALDHFKRAQKAHEITEDVLSGLEEEVQQLTDNYIKEIDKHIDNKVNEILTV